MRGFYDTATVNERKLARADYIGHRVIPVGALLFVAAYWILGILMYQHPDLEFSGRVNSEMQVGVDTAYSTKQGHPDLTSQ